MKLIDYLTNYFDEISVVANKLNYKLKIYQRDPQKTYVAFLYSYILHLSESFISLVRRNDYDSLPVLLRAILEATVELINLTDDKNYFEVMRANFYKEKRRFLKNSTTELCFKDDECAPTQDIIQNEIKWTQSMLSKLKSQGINPMDAKKRFYKASQDSHYQYTYRYLSGFLHSSINILPESYIESGKHIQLLKFRVVSRKNLYNLIHIFTGLVFYSTVKVNKQFGYPDDHNMLNTKLSMDSLLHRLNVLAKRFRS